jgi:hypothetical protein
MGFGHSMTLGLGFPTLRERKAIEEAEGLHLGLLSSRDAYYDYWVKLGEWNEIWLSWANEVGVS